MRLRLVETAVELLPDDGAQLRDIVVVVHLGEEFLPAHGGLFGRQVAEVFGERQGESLQFAAQLGRVLRGGVHRKFREGLGQEDLAGGDDHQPHQDGQQDPVKGPGKHGRGRGELVSDGDDAPGQHDQQEQRQRDYQGEQGLFHIR